jgi:hypothetical protein
MHIEWQHIMLRGKNTITLESKDRRIGKQKIVLQLVTKNMRIRQVYRCNTRNTILGRYMTIRYGVHVVLFRTCQMSNKFKVTLFRYHKTKNTDQKH